jgi:hypothetical protein
MGKRTGIVNMNLLQKQLLLLVQVLELLLLQPNGCGTSGTANREYNSNSFSTQGHNNTNDKRSASTGPAARSSGATIYTWAKPWNWLGRYCYGTSTSATITIVC